MPVTKDQACSCRKKVKPEDLQESWGHTCRVPEKPTWERWQVAGAIFCSCFPVEGKLSRSYPGQRGEVSPGHLAFISGPTHQFLVLDIWTLRVL